MSVKKVVIYLKSIPKPIIITENSEQSVEEIISYISKMISDKSVFTISTSTDSCIIDSTNVSAIHIEGSRSLKPTDVVDDKPIESKPKSSVIVHGSKPLEDIFDDLDEFIDSENEATTDNPIEPIIPSDGNTEVSVEIDETFIDEQDVTLDSNDSDIDSISEEELSAEVGKWLNTPL